MHISLAQVFSFVIAAILTAGVAGCGKRSEAPSGGAGSSEAVAASASASAPKSSDNQSAEQGGAVATVQKAAQRAAEGAKEVVKATEETAAKAQESAVQATEKAQALLQQAKGLLDEKKVQQAGGLLDQVAGMTLDDSQQQLLTGLQQQAKQLYGEVEKGLGDLKELVAQKNYSDATALVSRLADYEFSPEQQKLYDDLKAQAQK